MAFLFVLLSIPAVSAVCTTWDTDPVACVRRYNVRWDDLHPDTNISYVNTMPIGNQVGGANVWTNGKDTVTLMLSSQHAWNEGAQLIKIGRVDLTYTPRPSPLPFSQEMDLGTGTVKISIGALRVEVWMDADGNAAVVSHSSVDKTVFKVSSKVVLVRTEETQYAGVFECRDNYSISPDVLISGNGDTFTHLFYHRNEQNYAGQDYFADMIAEQNLGKAAHESVPNKLYNRTSGAAVSEGDSQVVVTFLTAQTATQEEYVAQLKASINLRPSKTAHDNFYKTLWELSHIELEDTLVSSKYFIQRYMQTIQARAPFPIKFNGLIFTANKPPKVDFREWGGRNWWQNARLSYYNMFTSGDYEQVENFLESYYRTLPMAKARTAHYYNFTGAFWVEYSDALFGTQHSKSYGCGRAGKTDPPYWWNADIWNSYNMQGSLDLSLFTLDFYVATGNPKYVEIAVEVIQFFMNWRKELDADGRIILFPSQALETWQCPGYPVNATTCVTNDMPTVAGLIAVVEKLLTSGYGSSSQRDIWTAYQAILPEMPIAVRPGSYYASLLPAQILPTNGMNVENTELYAVHPYRRFTAARKGVDLLPATIAYDIRWFQADQGWDQCIMDAALLGMADEFKKLAFNRANVTDAVGYRFPGFMQHYQDYQPSADHLANLNNGISYALLQQDDTAAHGLRLLPAWPCSWDVDFKVHGALNTTITGSLVNGTLSYTVSPLSRAKDVSAAPCQY